MSFGDKILGGLRSIVLIEERVKRLDENLGALEVSLDADELRAIDAVFPPDAAAGPRYVETMMRMVNV